MQETGPRDGNLTSKPDKLWAFFESADLDSLDKITACEDPDAIKRAFDAANEERKAAAYVPHVFCPAEKQKALPLCTALKISLLVIAWAIGIAMSAAFFLLNEKAAKHVMPPESATKPSAVTAKAKDLGKQPVEDLVGRPNLIKVLEWYKDSLESSGSKSRAAQMHDNFAETANLTEEERAAFAALIKALQTNSTQTARPSGTGSP